MLDTLSSAVLQGKFLLKVAAGVIALVATTSAVYTGGKAFIELPAKVAHHDSVTMAGFKSIDRMLCIQVADHRNLDWNLCYINPSQVVPNDDGVLVK